MTLMEIKLQRGNNGYAVCNQGDLESTGIRDGQPVIISDEDKRSYAILRAHVSPDAPRDLIIGDQNILGNIISDGSLVEIERFTGQIVPVNKATIIFRTLDKDPTEMFQERTQQKLAAFLESYYLNASTTVYWPEYNTDLTIKITSPNQEVNQAYNFIRNRPVDIKLQEQAQKMPFNAILLIDRSGSMNHIDVDLSGVEGTVNDIKNTLMPDSSQDYRFKYPSLNRLLSKLLNRRSQMYLATIGENGSQDSPDISRLDSVILATLLFFQQKISRGFGEKCSFVLYADEAKIIRLNNKNYIEATQFTADICDELIRIIKDSNYLRYGNTNISSAIMKCLEIAKEYKKINNNPVMILLLTDGTPAPKTLDDEKKLVNNVKRLKESLRQENIPFVLYAIGIGERSAVNLQLLQQITQISHGEEHFAKNVADLNEWYQRLAGNFAQSLKLNNWGN